jgi:hypothetical protein
MATHLTVNRKSGAEEFYVWDSSYQKSEKIFTIYTLTGKNRDEQVREGGYTVLLQTETVVYAAKVENLKPAAGEWEETKWYMMPQVKALVGRYSKLQDEAFYRFYLPIDNEFQTALTEQ